MALATPHGCGPRPKASRPARSILPFFPSRTGCSALAEPGKSQNERRALFGVIQTEYDVRAVLALRAGETRFARHCPFGSSFGWDPRAGIGAPSDVPAVDLAVPQLDGRREPGYANRLQHADDLGPPAHNLTVRLHPVQVRMQQRLERAPITLDDRGMRARCDVLHLGIVSHTDR
jgi:hypothetical protein